MDAPATGYDGPYKAPLPISGGKVRADWIDYNGHMNVAYYTMAFDQAIDRMLEDVLGIGESFVQIARQGPYALQANICYLAELKEGESFAFRMLMIDCDAKRMHVMLEMLKEDGSVAATCEELLMNVDLTARRSVSYPDWARTRMERMRRDHAGVERPPQLGARIGIRRKG